MSLKATEKVDTNRYALTVEIDAQAFGAAVDKATARGIKNITIPGFRKGKAPKAMILSRYGEDLFYQDALEDLYPDAADAALEESGLELAERKVDFELISMDKNGVSFKLLVTVKPDVTLGEYKGLKAERPVVEVTDHEVEHELEHRQEHAARFVPVEDRAAQNGDVAVIDYEGFTDGKAFAGGKGEGYSLELGSGSFIPGFEEQIVGHSAGDELDVNVIFPTEYHAEELAGKEAVFKVKIHELKAKELPALDDEFAKDVSEFDTLDELKKDIHDKMAESKNAQADAQVENALIEQIVAGMTVDVPDCMVEERIDENIRDFENRLRYQGLDLKTYRKYTGMSDEDFRGGFRENALKQVKVRLALETIAKTEKLEATEEELNAEYDKIAEMYGMKAEQVKAAISAKDLTGDIVCNKAVDLIKSSAVVTDEKPAKKPAAKKTAAKKAAPKAEAETAAEPAAEKPAKKAPAKKPAAKKPAAKKTEEAPAEEKPAAKKPAAKKAPAKKAAPKKKEEPAE